jgi:uncharacterized protein
VSVLDRLRRLLPSPEAVQANRWLRWIGPALHHPRLWHMSRRGIALGAALGVFFGLLIPVAQLPLAAGAAVVLRANVPTAVASTLVTNPVTFGPVYYVAWKFGSWVLHEPAEGGERPATSQEDDAAIAAAQARGGLLGWVEAAWLRLAALGKPLFVGLVIFACVFGVCTYAVVSAVWHWRVRAKRRRRLARRATPGR